MRKFNTNYFINQRRFSENPTGKFLNKNCKFRIFRNPQKLIKTRIQAKNLLNSLHNSQEQINQNYCINLEKNYFPEIFF